MFIPARPSLGSLGKLRFPFMERAQKGISLGLDARSVVLKVQVQAVMFHQLLGEDVFILYGFKPDEKLAADVGRPRTTTTRQKQMRDTLLSAADL